MRRLIRLSPFPPLEFKYEQDFNGRPVTWAGEGLSLEMQARRVQAFRKMNGLPRSSLGEVMDDINLYTCARLGGNERYCAETGENGMAMVLAAPKRGGGCCGASV